MQSDRLIPGPRLPAVLQTAWWFFGRFSFARGCSRRYGRCFRVRLLGFGEVVVLSDPAAIRRVLDEQADALAGGAANSFGGLIEELAGPGSLLLSDGPGHARLRAAIGPALDHPGLGFEAHARAAAQRSIAAWPRGEPFALMPHLQRICDEVFATTVLGVPERRRERAVAVLGEWSRAWNTPQVVLPVLRSRWGRRRVWRRFLAARRALRELIAAELRRAREGASEGRESVASRLLEAGALTEAEVGQQLLTLLVAGQPPTVNGLAWALELLARHPAALTQLRDGLAAEEEDYLDAVVSETLRLRPVGQWMARRVTRPLPLCGGTVRAGSLLVPNAFIAHHDETLHPRAEHFRPQRFLAGGQAGEASIPFGHGERGCPGSGLTKAQLRGVLREVVAALELEPGRARSERLVPDGISLVPKRGVIAVVRDRPPAARR